MACKFNNLFRHLGYTLFLCSVASIYVIKLTEWRFNIFINKYDEINDIILNLSYSYIAAMTFHLVINVFPGKHREKIMRRKVNAYMRIIRSSIHSCIMSIFLFCFDDKEPSKDEFIKRFGEQELSPNDIRLTVINSKRSVIMMKVEQILVVQDYLTDKELEVLLSIKDSLFLTKDIRPTEYIKDGNIKQKIPGSNQREIGESIYRIYELIRSIVK